MLAQCEPPEPPELSTSEDEEEAKSLATHIALHPTVVREAVSTRSARTGKLNQGDLLQVHDEQTGQKGVKRLNITVVPEVMPEDQYVHLLFKICLFLDSIHDMMIHVAETAPRLGVALC